MVEKRSFPVAGLNVTVWERSNQSTTPAAVVFVLHGRTGAMTDDYVEKIANAAVEKSGALDVICVAFVSSLSPDNAFVDCL